MKKLISVFVFVLLSLNLVDAQVGGVTRSGEVTTVKNKGFVNLNGQIVDCPSLAPSGQIIDYTASINPFVAGLDGMVNIALSITVTSIGNADSVGFDCATDTDFTHIVEHRMCF